nr:microplusin 3 [Haemaphysalis flava]
MKAVLALAFFAVVGLAYAQEATICTLPTEARHAVVECLKTHVNEETLGKFNDVKTRLQCDDLDCVFTKVCELSSDTHAQHAEFFSPETKTALRAAFAECRADH